MRNKKGQFVKGNTYVMSEEHKNKIAISKLGKSRPAWVKKKISEAKKGKYLGEDACNWRGGRIFTSNGYVFVYSPNHPNKTADGYVLEHRLVMEDKIGRFLEKDEVVHHINHNVSDNRILNLMLINKAKHNTIHHKGNSMSAIKGWVTKRKIKR